jgi:tetratricopeptide (TPR) repeat protein
MEVFPNLSTQIDLYLGQCYQQLDDPGRRLVAYERAVKRSPRSAPALAGLASAQAALGRLDDARDQYRRLTALPDPPASAWPDYIRLLLLRNRQRPEPRWEEVNEVLKLAREKLRATAKADLIELALVEAEARCAQNQGEAAEMLLESTCGLDPDNVKPWAAWIAFLDKRGEWGKAEYVYKTVRRHLDDRVELRLAWADHLANRDGKAAAKAIADLAANLDSFSPEQKADLLAGLAEVSCRVGNIQQGARFLTRAVSFGHRVLDLRLHLRLLELDLQAGDDAGAARVVAQIRRIAGPQGTWWPFARASHLIWQASQGRPNKDALLAEAHQLLETVTERRPAWPAVPLALAEIEDLRGNDQQARVYYRQATCCAENSSRVVQQLIQEGQALAARGERSAEVERKLRQAVAVAGSAPETWQSLIRYLAATGQNSQAEAALRKAQLSIPAHAAPQALGPCYEALGQLDQAQKLYQEALENNPGDLGVVRCVAGFYLRMHRVQQAKPLFAAVLSGRLPGTAADRAWARRGMAVVLADGTNYRRFLQALKLVGLEVDAAGHIALVGKQPPGERDENHLARVRVLASQPCKPFRTQAIAWLEELSGRRTLQAEDRFLLAELYEAEGEAGWPRARALLRGLTVVPGSSDLYLARLARSLLLHGEVPEAEGCIARLAEIEAARHLAGGALGSVELRARALELKGQEEEAYQLLAARAASKPPAADRLLALAGFLARQQRLQEALAQWERAWKVGPPELVGGAGVALLRAGHPSKHDCARVEHHLQKALKGAPDSPVLLVHMGELHDLGGNYEAAEKNYRNALARDPDNLMALNNLAWLLAQRKGQGARALPLIQQAIQRYGPRPDLLDTRAVVHLARGKAAPAINDLERVTRDDPSGSRYFHLARALRMAGQSQAALRALHKARASGLTIQGLHPMERGDFKKMAAELGKANHPARRRTE